VLTWFSGGTTDIDLLTLGDIIAMMQTEMQQSTATFAAPDKHYKNK
jgi:hypothetical protein